MASVKREPKPTIYVNMRLPQIMETLTPAMEAVLMKFQPGEKLFYTASYTTLDALRKRGMVERYSERVTKRVFARDDGEHVQFIDRKGIWVHDWWLSEQGERAQEFIRARQLTARAA